MQKWFVDENLTQSRKKLSGWRSKQQKDSNINLFGPIMVIFLSAKKIILKEYKSKMKKVSTICEMVRLLSIIQKLNLNDLKSWPYHVFVLI